MNLPPIGAYRARYEPIWCAKLTGFAPYNRAAEEFQTAVSPAREVSLSIHVALNHVTHYRYDRLVTLSPQIVRLRPAPHCRTRILGYSLSVQPAKHFINWQQDPEANYLARLTFPDKTRDRKSVV